MTKTFKQIREQDYERQRHRGGSKGKFDLLPKRHSRDSTSGSLTDKQIQNLKKIWNDPSNPKTEKDLREGPFQPSVKIGT